MSCSHLTLVSIISPPVSCRLHIIVWFYPGPSHAPLFPHLVRAASQISCNILGLKETVHMRMEPKDLGRQALVNSAGSLNWDTILI